MDQDIITFGLFTFVTIGEILIKNAIWDTEWHHHLCGLGTPCSARGCQEGWGEWTGAGKVWNIVDVIRDHEMPIKH